MTTARREDRPSSLVWWPLISWGWRAVRELQHLSYSPLNHVQTATLGPHIKPLPLPRKPMPSGHSSFRPPQASREHCPAANENSAPSLSSPLSRLPPSLEAVSRTVRSAHWDVLYSVLVCLTDGHFHSSNPFLRPTSKPHHLQDPTHLRYPKFSSMQPFRLLTLMTPDLGPDQDFQFLIGASSFGCKLILHLSSF